MMRDARLSLRSNVAAGHAGAISGRTFLSKSAELSYEPSELALAR
jgi:hypothetical protein